MYIDYIEIENFRTFRSSRISFCHADRDFAAAIDDRVVPGARADDIGAAAAIDRIRARAARQTVDRRAAHQGRAL